MTDPQSFAAWLQRERERRDITVRTIAERTKIGVGLLESLERGDVSRWPGGIYRRSFVRAYADAVGLDSDLVLANFERLFPDPDLLSAFDRVEGCPQGQRAYSDNNGMRLQLVSPAWPSAVAVRTLCLDLVFALSAGLAGWLVAGPAGFWCVTALAIVGFHACSVLSLRRAIRAAAVTAVAQWKLRRARAEDRAEDLAELDAPQPDPSLDLTYYAR